MAKCNQFTPLPLGSSANTTAAADCQLISRWCHFHLSRFAAFWCIL